jgi:hypothetical protein
MSDRKSNLISRRGIVAGLTLGGATTALGLNGTQPAQAQQANTGSVAWKQPGNNKHVLKLQEGKTGPSEGEVTLEYWGHCAFKITSPLGLTLLFDPWRNDPSGFWGVWFP